MKRLRTLELIEPYPKVMRFLNSKSTNSNRTKIIYGFALSHFHTFLKNSEYKNYNIETILSAINEKTINVYDLIDDFVQYLRLRQDANNGNSGLSSKSIQVYIVGIRSYLEYYDVDISSNKLKRRVTIPKVPKGIKQPIDAQDIRTILNACTNIRLKVFLLVLASSGMRANEALLLRNSDLDFDASPTKIHLRAENTKTKQANDIYISNEASKELKSFIDSKYGQVDEFKKYPEHLIFSLENNTDSSKMLNTYRAIHLFFTRTLKKIEMDKGKDGTKRRQINFHLFRAYVYTTVTNTVNTSFAQWPCSKSKSEYWESKESVRKELYLKCMKYLTFLDYPTVESVGKDFESKLQEKTQEINEMKKDLTRLKRFEIDYNTTFVQRFKEIEENLEYYENLYGPRASKKKSKIN